jgi:hypothetical protein
MSLNVWTACVMDAVPYMNEGAAQHLYHKAASCYWSDTQLNVQDGCGGWVDLTKLFEQCRIISILKGDNEK